MLPPSWNGRDKIVTVKLHLPFQDIVAGAFETGIDEEIEQAVAENRLKVEDLAARVVDFFPASVVKVRDVPLEDVSDLLKELRPEFEDPNLLVFSWKALLFWEHVCKFTRRPMCTYLDQRFISKHTAADLAEVTSVLSCTQLLTELSLEHGGTEEMHLREANGHYPHRLPQPAQGAPLSSREETISAEGESGTALVPQTPPGSEVRSEVVLVGRKRDLVVHTNVYEGYQEATDSEFFQDLMAALDNFTPMPDFEGSTGNKRRRLDTSSTVDVSEAPPGTCLGDNEKGDDNANSSSAASSSRSDGCIHGETDFGPKDGGGD